MALLLTSVDEVINNYWMRLREISWFVSGEQINLLPKPKARRQIIDLRDTDKSRYFAISIIVLSFDHQVCFHILTTSWQLMGSDLPFFSRERGSNYT